MAKTIEYVLNIDVNKSISSMSAMKTEMRAVSKAMQDASNAGNSAAYDKLAKRFVDLRDKSEDLNAKLQPMDKQIGILTSSVGALTQIGTNLAVVFGADNKSAEELFKTFAKAQAITAVVSGLNQMSDMLGKLPAALSAASSGLQAMGKAAYASLGPWGLLAAAIVAVVAAIAIYAMNVDNATEAEKKAAAQTKATAEVQQKSIEVYVEKNYELEKLGKTINNNSTSEKNLKEAIKKLSEVTGYDITLIKDRNKQIEIANRLIPMQIELIKMEAKAQAAKELYIETLKKQLNTQDKIDKSTPGYMDQIWNSITSFTVQGRAMNNVNTAMENYNNITAENERSLEAFNEIVEDSNYLAEQQKDLINQVATNYGLQENGAKKVTKAIRDKTEYQKLEHKGISSLVPDTKKLTLGIEDLAEMKEKEANASAILKKELVGFHPINIIQFQDFQELIKLYGTYLTMVDDENATMEERKAALKKFYDAQIDYKENYVKSAAELLAEQKAIFQQEFEMTQNFVNSIGALYNQLQNNKIDKIEEGYDDELKILNDTKTKTVQEEAEKNAKIEQLELEKNKRIERLQKEAGQKKKAMAISNVMVDTAQAIMKGFGEVGPLAGTILTILTMAESAAQIALISQQQYAKGGLLVGPSHAQGGILTQFGEMEGGEAVINKNATRRFAPVLSYMNQSTGGNAIGSSSSQLIDYELLASKINDKRVYLVESDVTKSQRKVQTIESRSKI